MRKSPGHCVASALIFCLLAVPAVKAQEIAPQSDGRYLVKFRTYADAANAVTKAGGRTARELVRQRVVAVYLSEQGLRFLRSNPNVESVGVDQRRYPMAQSKPYGIGIVQADDPVLINSSSLVGSTVCIIDSGYFQAHEDLQVTNVTGTSDSGTGNWYEDSCGQSTMRLRWKMGK